MKKEAYKQTLNVSENFQSELKDTIPQTVQRLLRENIVLENELVRLWNDYANMDDEYTNHEYVTNISIISAANQCNII